MAFDSGFPNYRSIPPRGLRDPRLSHAQSTAAFDCPPQAALLCRALVSSRYGRRRPAPRVPVHGNGLQSETVLSSRNHRQRCWCPGRQPGRVLQFQPGTKPPIVDLTVALPEFRLQAAFDLQMIEQQFNCGGLFREIAPDVGCAHVQAGYRRSSVLNFYQHF